MTITNSYSWSSSDNAWGFNTHIFFNKKAYAELEKHPAFEHAGFPKLKDINRWGKMVSECKRIIKKHFIG